MSSPNIRKLYWSAAFMNCADTDGHSGWILGLPRSWSWAFCQHWTIASESLPDLKPGIFHVLGEWITGYNAEAIIAAS